MPARRPSLDLKDGLIKDADLAPLDGVLEVGLKHGALVGGAAHFGLEQLDPVRARALGPVHGALALAKQIFGGFLRAVIHGNADAAGDDEVAPAYLHRRAQRAPDPLGKHGDMAGLGILGNQDRELQGADARKRVLRRDVPGKPARYGQKHAVVRCEIRGARLVLKRVEIEEKDRRLHVLVLGAGECGLKPVDEQLSIGQARQPVPDGVVKQALLRALLRGDVAQEADAAKRPGVALLRYARAQFVPEIAAIGAFHPEFKVDVAALALADRPQGQAHALAVGGMKMLQPVFERASQRCGLKAERGFDLRPGADFVAPPVPFPYAAPEASSAITRSLNWPASSPDRSRLAGLKRVLGDVEADQGQEQHEPRRQRRNHDVARDLAEDGDGAGEQPDHEQHPGRHERQRPFLAAQSARKAISALPAPAMGTKESRARLAVTCASTRAKRIRPSWPAIQL